MRVPLYPQIAENYQNRGGKVHFFLKLRVEGKGRQAETQVGITKLTKLMLRGANARLHFVVEEMEAVFSTMLVHV